MESNQNQKLLIPIVALLLMIFIARFSLIADFFFGNAENPKGNLITLFIQLLGGVAIIGTLWISVKRLKTLEESNVLSNKQFLLAEKGNITERFSRSVDQLGNEKDAIRLGGIYALYRIATEEVEYRETICEILCAFVRSESIKIKESKSKREDFQAIINLFKTKNPTFSTCYKNLSGCVFYKISINSCLFQSANFSGSAFEDVEIENSDFSHSTFCNVSFSNSEINRSFLVNAKIEKSKFTNCKLLLVDATNSILEKSNFEKVDLRDSLLNHAVMNNIEWKFGNIIRTSLEDCSLNSATLLCDFENTDLINIRCNSSQFCFQTFKDCNFSGSDLGESDFSYSKHFRSNFTSTNLQSTDFRNAYLDKTTFSNANNIDKCNFTNVTFIK